MTDFTIPDLSNGGAISVTDLFEVYQGSAPSVKITAAQIKTFVSASPTLVTPAIGVAAGTTLALGGATIGANALAVTGTAAISGRVQTTSSFQLGGTGGTLISQQSDGVLTLWNSTVNGFDRIQLGGITTSFPGIFRNAAAINFKLADGSADAAITAAGASFSGAAVNMTALATADPHVVGRLWSNLGIVTVSAG